MPSPKRWFPVSHEFPRDPEVHVLMREFGDRFLLTWLYILSGTDQSHNQFRWPEDTLQSVSRSLLQTAESVRAQVLGLLKRGWIHAVEMSASGWPTVLMTSNYAKYHKVGVIAKSRAGDAGLPSEPSDPNHPNHPSLIPLPSPPPTPSPSPIGVRKNNPSAGATRARRPHNDTPVRMSRASEVWVAYATAYERVYKVPPTRNAKTNAQLARLVERLGVDESIAVAAWFPSHRASLYVHAGHCTDLLLRDAEKLRTEWARGRTITSTQAQQIDRHEAMGQVVTEALALMEAHDADERTRADH